MSAFLQAIVIGLTLSACTGNTTIDKRDSKSDKSGATTDKSKTGDANPDGAKQPTNISGDLNLHSLSCDVTNANDDTAKDAIIGCIVKDETGTKYNGDVSSVVADVFVTGSDKPVAGQVTVLNKDQPYNFMILVGSTKPTSANALKVNALVGGKAEQWLIQLRIDLVHATAADMHLYVRAGDPKAGPLCTKEAPCTSITKALTFVPAQIGHVVTVHVAPGNYTESIVASGKFFPTANGQLVIVGEDNNFVASNTASFQLTPPLTVNAGIAVSAQVDYQSDLVGTARFQFKNLSIIHSSTPTAYGSSYVYGAYAREADLLLSNVQVKGAWDIAIGASFNTQMYLNGVTVSGFSDAGLDVFSNGQMFLQNSINISGGVVGIRAEQNGQLFWDKNNGDGQSIVSIDFGNKLDPDTRYIGLHILDGQVAEHECGGDYRTAVLSIKNATEAIRVEHGKLILNATNVSATGCQSHCVASIDHGIVRFQGLATDMQMSLNLAGVSADAGSMLAADLFSSIEILDYTGLKMCNIQTGTNSFGRFIAAATGSAMIRTSVASTMPKTTYSGCSDASANRKVSFESGSQVQVNGAALSNGATFNP